MRLWFRTAAALPLAFAVLAIAAAWLVPSASASRVPIAGGAAPAALYTGADSFGKVTLGYYSPTPALIVDFTFANRCDRQGSRVKATIELNTRTRRFRFQNLRFLITGRAVGRLSHPSRLAGTALIARPGCVSGPLGFTVKPAHNPYP
jgi:hypothetical protein